MNLLTETKNSIKESGHTKGDIVFIGSDISGHSCTWKVFVALANTEYDCGYGSQEVAHDLIIVFSDGGTLRRDEYDGAEGWTYYRPFEMPKETKSIETLFGGYDGLA